MGSLDRARDELEQLLKEVEPGRRKFLKELLLGMSYATPIVSVFTMQALNIDSAMAAISNICSNIAGPNLIEVEKTAAPDPVIAGQNLTYTIRLKSCGVVAPGTSVTFTDDLPGDTTFVSVQHISGPLFTFTFPAVGTNGTVVGTSSVPMNHDDVTVIEIVVKVLANVDLG